jgi:iron complex transport system ATP-binding protein
MTAGRGLRLSGISVDLAGRRVVQEVSLHVPVGSFVGLLGPNGSGKSTVLKAVFGALPVATGSITLDGQSLATMSPRDRARRIAVLAQDTTIEFTTRVDEFVMLGRIPHQTALARNSRQDRAVVAEALDQVGCSHLARREISALSGGERQRVLVARALAQRCDYVILDEPTNHLDIRYQMEILELLTRLPVTVLAALHDLSLAALFCDQMTVLAAGRAVATGPPHQVITESLVQEVYGATVLVVPHPETSAPQLLARRRPPTSEGTLR